MKLKNNEIVSIRVIKNSDAAERHEFFVELSLAQIGMLHTIDEIDFHVADSTDKIEDFSRNKRGLWLIAQNAQSKIIGEVDITIKNLQRVRHVGQVTIGVLPSYQGLGLGSLLMDEAIAWAEKSGLLRLELSVFASNKTAIALYKKCGFVVEGLRKGFLRQADGSFEDDLLMARILKRIS